jgi:hypothetical protein
MKQFTAQEFITLLQQASIKPRVRRDIRFVPDAVTDLSDRELLAVSTKSGREGVLVIELDNVVSVYSYELLTRVADATGRSKPITCDFCHTWQRGSNAGRITFTRKSDGHTLTFLCCGDLACSLHVRGKTPQALLSRTQLHEDLTNEQRVKRLQQKLQKLMIAL